MKYDDASWHYGGDFPKELPNDAGATHIGMFVSWATLNGLSSSLHTKENTELYRKLKSRKITPAQYFILSCDEKFTDEDLNDTGNAFAHSYFVSKENTPGRYINDYEKMFGDTGPSLYHVADTWENYDKIAPLITEGFKQWTKLVRPKT